MSTQQIVDYLTKQLFIEKNIVTYRSLSRQFSLHVNVAKNELATYHTNAPYQSQACSATYLLSGEVETRRTRSDYNSGDVDMGYEGEYNVEGSEEDDGDEVPQMKITVVNEKDLEDAKAKYYRLYSVHFYSLSPSPIYDADLLCSQTEAVRKTDNTKGAELALIVGRIIGDNIKMKTGTGKKMVRENAAAVAGPSKPRLAASKLATVSAKPPPEQKDDEPPKEKTKITADKPKDKPTATGKITFKAKPKEAKKEVAQPQKEEKPKKQFFMPKPTSRASSVTSEKEPEKEPPKKQIITTKPASRVPSVTHEKESGKEPAKRGVKRKSTAHNLSESDEASASTSAMPVAKPSKPERNSVRVKKGVVLSDDGSDVPQKSRRKPRASVISSENERKAMSLMDIDDDEVIKVSRDVAGAKARRDEDEESEDAKTDEAPPSPKDEDVEMGDDSEPAPKPKKKKEKKVVPVGKNGLKKKRVIKSRESVDAKGYTIMEDYSSYESVDEEEPESKPKAKGKAKTKAPATVKQEAEDSDAPLAAPAKPAAMKKIVPAKAALAKAKPTKAGGSSKGGQQKGIAGFFGPAKAKK